MARGFSGVKNDLSELARHLPDVTCLFPPLVATNYTDSPPSSPHRENPIPGPSSNNPDQQQQRSRVAGVLRDLAEFSGGLRSGIARISDALMRTVAVNSGGMREELVLFVKDLTKYPESWLEFSMPLDDNFDMSRHQRDHIATVECLVPSLATLRKRLCPSLMSLKRFWKIYFALLHPRLNELESEFLSTQQIVEEMITNLQKKMQNRLNFEPLPVAAESSSSLLSDKEMDTQQKVMHVNLKKNKQNRVDSESQNLMVESCSPAATEKADDTQQEADQSQVRPTSTEATTLQYIDSWFDTRQHICNKEDGAYSEVEDGDNIVLLKKYGSAMLVEAVDEDYSLISSNARLRLGKEAYSGDNSGKLLKLPSKGLTGDETADWHTVEYSFDYELVEGS